MTSRSPEAVAARRVKAAISDIGLDPTVFAYIFVDNDPVIQARMFAIVLALINQWASEYGKGTIENYAVDSMRLRDTMDNFQMEVRG